MTWVVVGNAAEVRTANFTVRARQADIARQVAKAAEHYRKTKAIEWLGREMPDWGQPCTLEVKLTMGGAGGATSFAFDNGRILSQQMTVEGSLERVINSVLPHEITHTVFAYKFRRPLPRWADEGGAVLSEDYQELARHDILVRSLINNGRMIPLPRLFTLTEYPRDVMALYAQGFSIANYLVSLRGRPEFLDFVWEGQTNGWAPATQRHYGFRSLAELEKSWIDWLIAGRGTGADRPDPQFAAAPPRRNSNLMNAHERQPVRESGNRTAASREFAALAPERRVARGQMPDDDGDSGFATPARPAMAGRPAESPLMRDRPNETLVGAPARSAITPIADKRPRREEPIETVRDESGTDPSTAAAKSPAESTDAAGATVSTRPPRRLIPIAVGRTRRSHPDETSSTSGYGR